MSLKSTLGYDQWLKNNEQALKELFPETWTHIKNLNVIQLGFKLKLMGIDWRSEDELGKIMVFLERIGIMLRDGLLVRRNPNSIFKSSIK